jgi:hypothetical protein
MSACENRIVINSPIADKPEVIPDKKSASGKAEVPFGACGFPADHGMTDTPNEFRLRLAHGGRPLHGHEFPCQTFTGVFN